MASLDGKLNVANKQLTMHDCFEQLLIAQVNIDCLYSQQKEKAKDSNTIRIIKSSIYDIQRKGNFKPVCKCYKDDYGSGTIIRIDTEAEELKENIITYNMEKFDVEMDITWNNFDLKTYSAKFPKISWQIYHQCKDTKKDCIIIREADPHPIDRICLVELCGKYHMAKPIE
jgi:hypothetical protein